MLKISYGKDICLKTSLEDFKNFLSPRWQIYASYRKRIWIPHFFKKTSKSESWEYIRPINGIYLAWNIWFILEAYTPYKGDIWFICDSYTYPPDICLLCDSYMTCSFLWCKKFFERRKHKCLIFRVRNFCKIFCFAFSVKKGDYCSYFKEKWLL